MKYFMKAILFANNPTSFTQFKKTISSLKRERKLAYWIACDGGAYLFRKSKIYPDLIIGDFDSLKLEDQKYFSKNKKTKIIYDSDQNTTDLEKALLFCQKKKFTEVTLLFGIGQRADHSIYHLGLLKKFYSKKMKIRMISEYDETIYTENRKTLLKKHEGRIISFFGFPQAVVSTWGLQYNLINKKINQSDSVSVSNKVVNSDAGIELSGGGVLLIKENKT